MSIQSKEAIDSRAMERPRSGVFPLTAVVVVAGSVAVAAVVFESGAWVEESTDRVGFAGLVL